jgi:hypothetical protein
MKIIRKISILLLLAAAQTVDAQIGYGPEVAIGLSNMRFAPDMAFTEASKSSAFSFRIGGVADIPLNRKIYFQSGLLLSKKGHQRSFAFYVSDSLNESVDQTLTLYYVELPLNLCFKTQSQGKGRFTLGAGATLSNLAFGRNVLNASGASSGVPYTTHIDEPVSDGKPLSAFDASVNAFMGYELPNGLAFKAYYTSGLNDLGLGTEIDKNRIGGIAATWYFGKGRSINQEKNDLIEK